MPRHVDWSPALIRKVLKFAGPPIGIHYYIFEEFRHREPLRRSHHPPSNQSPQGRNSLKNGRRFGLNGKPPPQLT